MQCLQQSMQVSGAPPALPSNMLRPMLRAVGAAQQTPVALPALSPSAALPTCQLVSRTWRRR